MVFYSDCTNLHSHTAEILVNVLSGITLRYLVIFNYSL